MLVGAVLITAAVYVLSDRPSAATVAVGVLAGMILGRAVWATLSR